LADLDRLDRARPVLAAASFSGSVPSPAAAELAAAELAEDVSPADPELAADAPPPSAARSFLGAEAARAGRPAADARRDCPAADP
jgi:hypothetical protein